MAKDLLFEIGIEEIPARFMEPALKQLRELAADGLQQAGWNMRICRFMARRAALLCWLRIWRKCSRTASRKAKALL